MAAFVVPTPPSLTFSPLPSRMQYRLFLSPMSMPIVIGAFHTFLSCVSLFPSVLFFFMAGLLLHFECVSHWELNSIPPGDRPSHSISRISQARAGKKRRLQRVP